MTSHVTQHVRFDSCLSNIDVESLGFRFDQQEICDQFICEVAGFNEDTLALFCFCLISVSLTPKFPCDLSRNIVAGLKTIFHSHILKLTRVINLTKLISESLWSDVGRSKPNIVKQAIIN